MADTSTFPTLTNVLYAERTMSFTAGADISAGMALGFAGTGVSLTVHPVVGGTTVTCIGVAWTSADSGDEVTVIMGGPIVEMVEGAGAAIDAGDWVQADDASIGGCIKTAVTTGTVTDAIGVAVADIAANGHGKVMLMPSMITKAAT